MLLYNHKEQREQKRKGDKIMTKVEMVQKMVENGYYLFDETVEHFANRFSEENIKMFMENFMKWKGEK